MKKFTYTILVILLCLSCNSVFANVVVTDITDPIEMNGIYVEQTGLYNDKPYYLHIDEPNYCIYYEGDAMIGEWRISMTPGPFTSLMPMTDYYFYIPTDGTINTPPSGGYIPNVTAMGPDPIISGNPIVSDSPVIPISMWAIVFIFFITGAFIVYRSYKKRQIA